MTPTPTSGDIWEWTGHHDPAVFLLIKYNSTAVDDYWLALNLTVGTIEEIAMHQYNAPHWRFLA